MWIQTNMLKTKVNRSVNRIVPARAGRSTDRLPATDSGAPANKSNVVPKRSGETAQAMPPPTDAANGGARLVADLIRTKSGVDLTAKIRELLILAKEQGHLTYDDINDALPETIVTPDELDQIYSKLKNLSLALRRVLKNRMREYFTYGSVGGAGGNPGSYPAPNVGPATPSGNSGITEGPPSVS